MTKYARHVSTRSTPQREKARADQVQNSAGGYVFAIDPMKQLERWLILGAEGGTYYAGERELTIENAKTISACLDTRGLETVETIARMSESGRAPKNDPAIFALAIAAAHPNDAVRSAALAAIPRVCRIGTHLFKFVATVQGFRGWGRGLRNAIGNWYNKKTADALAREVVKYQQREGWSHRDVMRLCHPEPKHDAIFRYVVAGAKALGERTVVRREDGSKTYPAVGELAPYLAAFEEMKRADKAKAIALIREHKFPHECVPSELLSDPEVWEALLYGEMGLTAMIRNLGRMTANGLLKPMGQASGYVAGKLGSTTDLKKARVHPIQIFSALMTYRSGSGVRGKLSWSPITSIVDALDEAFYLSFGAVDPTGKKHLLAIDVSGSMDSGEIAGVPGLTPRMAAACMAMVTARAESTYHIVGFAAPKGGAARVGQAGGRWGGGTPSLVDLAISPRMRLDDVCKVMQKVEMGGTDCSLPMVYATRANVGVDVFAIYTDNETWHSPEIHPFQALRQYRERHNPKAKLAVTAFSATPFTIAPPNDPGCIDLVGFDSAAPSVLANFAREE